MFLFDIPPMTKWTTDQVANIINIFSAIGTVGAFLYAFYLERRNSKKINDLAEITKELSNQNKLIIDQNELIRLQMENEAAPFFSNVNVEIDYHNGSIWLKMVNKGHPVKWINAHLPSNDLKFQEPEFLPKFIGKDEQVSLLGFRNKEIPIGKCKYNLVLTFKNNYGNRFLYLIIGEGEKAELR
ncbi:MAG: hypothetical protein EOO04_13115 [Chitinophagaceae bacterium]|nr:MAG: hypothetical protein EOO04_13115 [Chitinophagaceae bacterium]